MHPELSDPNIDLARDWQLFCLPDDEESYPVNLAELRLFQLLSGPLNLIVTRDDTRREIYVSNGLTSQSEEDADEDVDDEEAGWTRYPSNWMAKVVSLQESGPTYEAIEPAAAGPLIPAFPDAQLSQHFMLSEFRPGQHSYDYIRISPDLIRALEIIRERVGAPLTVTSGYRPIAYNRKVGGVSNSTHIDGLAADIFVDGMATEELHAICDEVIGDRGGVGFYPTLEFVHIDLRGYRARWSGR